MGFRWEALDSGRTSGMGDEKGGVGEEREKVYRNQQSHASYFGSWGELCRRTGVEVMLASYFQALQSTGAEDGGFTFTMFSRPTSSSRLPNLSVASFV